MEHILEGKPEISYPCEWDYKVILEKDQYASKLFDELLAPLSYTFKSSNSSKSGKYESYLVSLSVNSEEQRLEIFNKFKAKAKYVL